MKLHRFIGDYDLTKKEIEILDPKIIKQIKGILRLEKDEKIILSNGLGENAEVTLNLISTNKISGTIDKIEKKNKTKRRVSLYLAILKKENFELAVQKAVEAGVSEITPVITERTIKTGLNIDRLKKIILEASEQSGRSFVPTLSPILKFKDAIAAGNDKDEKVIFHLENDFYSPNKEAKNVSIFIGPEGGFTANEIDWATNSGYSVFSLGSLTLRAETAAIIATYRVVKGI
ncbi:MAG: RsmE family RNA methyltransferase [bacterium]